jgi:ABC-type Fe3+-siderophore transport system permease subunit
MAALVGVIPLGVTVATSFFLVTGNGPSGLPWSLVFAVILPGLVLSLLYELARHHNPFLVAGLTIVLGGVVFALEVAAIAAMVLIFIPDLALAIFGIVLARRFTNRDLGRARRSVPPRS